MHLKRNKSQLSEDICHSFLVRNAQSIAHTAVPNLFYRYPPTMLGICTFQRIKIDKVNANPRPISLLSCSNAMCIFSHAKKDPVDQSSQAAERCKNKTEGFLGKRRLNFDPYKHSAARRMNTIANFVEKIKSAIRFAWSSKGGSNNEWNISDRILHRLIRWNGFKQNFNAEFKRWLMVFIIILCPGRMHRF